jgi:hypothetical protein
MFTTPFTFQNSATPAVIGNRLALDTGNASSYPGSGSSWFDLSGNSNTVTLSNSPTFSSSNGGFLTFNGSSQFGTATSSASLGITGPISLEYWVNLNTGDFILLSKAPYTGGSANQNGNYMFWLAPGYVIFTSSNGGANVNNVRNNATNSTTAWEQHVFTYDGSTFKFYLNGNLLTGNIITTGPTPLSTTTENLLICRRKDGYGYYNGDLSVINLYDYILTPGQIKANWRYYKSRY